MAPEPPTPVTFVITTLGVGGAETQLTRVATAMARSGRRVRVLALRERAGFAASLAAADVPVQVLTPAGRRLGIATWRALLVALRREPDGCVVTLLLQANVLGRLAGAWCGLPVVSSIRNTRFGGDQPWGARAGDLLERLTMSLARLVVFNARSTADAVVARGVVPAAKVRIVPNALPASVAPLGEAERASARAELGLGGDTFLWLTAGRLQPQKNVPALLEAFARVARETPRAALWVAGEGPLAGALADQAAALGLDDAVRFLGLRRDLPRLLQVADAFVLASRWEGLPNALMEAQAAGVPTVATPVGGVDELIEDEVSGWLAASPEPDDLAAAMRRLTVAESERRRQIAATGRERVLVRFGLDAAVVGWEAAIAEAHALHGRRAR